VIYRHGGVIVLPNEDGLKDSALMEMVEVNGSPWLGDDWVYDAKAISKDGLVIVGQLSRPDGWEYLTGDVPEPSIGVWWNIHYLDGVLVVSRARPVLMMNEPVDDGSNVRCSYRHRFREWLDELIEWIQAFFLDQSWNYLADATGFVSSDMVLGGIPDGSYVVAGPDKNGTFAWAWLTAGSVYNIEAEVNNPPNPPVIPPYSNPNDPYIPLPSFSSVDVKISYSVPADQDGDVVYLEYESVVLLDDNYNIVETITDAGLLSVLDISFSPDPDSADSEILSINGLSGAYTSSYSWKKIAVILQTVDPYGAVSSTEMLVFKFLGS